jgi:PHD/YefM family antitoxin component YafN of YafNO toxin-antitoxin module
MSSEIPTMDRDDLDEDSDAAEIVEQALGDAVDEHAAEQLAADATDGLTSAARQLQALTSQAQDEDEIAATVLPEFELDESDGTELQPTRPALANLNEQQLDALREFRDEGVEHRPALLRWLLRLQFRTLGRLPDYWYHHVATDPTALACVLTGENRGAYGEKDGTDVTPNEAWATRRRLVAKYLRPACRDAFRTLRPKATEYLEDEKDPDKMAALAMRPALDEHYQRTERALAQFHRGFAGEDELDEWLHHLDLATFGAIKAVESDFDYVLLTDETAPDLYLSDAEQYVEVREWIMARYLLPATNVAVRELAERAGETDDETSDHSGGVDV